MELKTIQVKDVLGNFSQPREHFDKEKIKKLAESILSNGLIQPITIREDPKRKGKYMIVAGERRTMAHRIAKLKTIQAVVKEYKNDGQWMIESLIENIHREDLAQLEKAKYAKQIMVSENIPNINQLSKKISIPQRTVSSWFELLPIEKLAGTAKKKGVSESTVLTIAQRTKNDKLRKELINYASKNELGDRSMRKITSITDKATPEVKEALLDDKISVEQAEDISKINNDKARAQALKQTEEHKKLADITPKVMENANPELSEAVKKQFNTKRKIIFDNLYNSRVGIIKANKFLNKANQLLAGLLSRQFEYALDDKTLKMSLQQIKNVSDEMAKFNLNLERFEELKEDFIDRIDNKDD